MGNLIAVGLLVSYRLSSDSFAEFLPKHKQVLDAIAARRPERAQQAMARLLSKTRAYLSERIDSPGSKPRPYRAGQRGRAPIRS